MVWYADGSIQVEANGQVATGTGTAFLKNVRIGDGLTIAGSASMHEVTNIASDTQLTFSPPYTGAAGAGKQYRIAPIQGYVKEAADLLRSLTQNLGAFANGPTLQSLAGLQGAAGQGLRFKSAGELEAFLLGTAAARNVTESATDNTAGRLLKVGDFGVGSPILLPSPNLNELTANGYYYASNPSNGPVANNGYLTVETATPAYSKQTFTTVVEGYTYERQKVENVWQPWKRLFDEFGANSNGSYTRLAGGQLICVTVAKNRPLGAGVLAFDWPSSFMPGEAVSASASIVPSSRWEVPSGVYAYPTGAQVYFSTSSPDTLNTITVIGMGRWK